MPERPPSTLPPLLRGPHLCERQKTPMTPPIDPQGRTLKPRPAARTLREQRQLVSGTKSRRLQLPLDWVTGRFPVTGAAQADRGHFHPRTRRGQHLPQPPRIHPDDRRQLLQFAIARRGVETELLPARNHRPDTRLLPQSARRQPIFPRCEDSDGWLSPLPRTIVRFPNPGQKPG